MNTTPSATTDDTLTAFAGFARIAHGPRDRVVAELRAARLPQETFVRVFEDRTGTRLDLDLRPDAGAASPAEAEAEPPTAQRRGVGRPKLGVVAREVTLLPRHWEWLNQQRGGASVALRRLVDEARRASETGDTQRLSREVAYRVMSDMAGDLPAFEEATRALFAGDRSRFTELTAAWPDDLRDYVAERAAAAWNPA